MIISELVHFAEEMTCPEAFAINKDYKTLIQVIFRNSKISPSKGDSLVKRRRVLSFERHLP